MRRTIFALLMYLVLHSSSAAHAQMPVTACGQVVQGAGVLSADLECGAGSAVILKDKGSLDLAGNTLTVGAGIGVECFDTCAVSNGTIGGAGAHCILGQVGASRISLDGVTLEGCQRGVVGSGKIEAVDSILRDIPDYGFFSLGKTIRLDKVTMESVGGNTAVSTSYLGRGSIKVVDSVFTDAFLFAKKRIKMQGSTITGGAGGISAASVAVSDSSITDCRQFGLQASNKLRAKNVIATGSGFDCFPGSTQCGDIVSWTKPPRLRDVTCDTSADLGGGNWGVCALD